MSHNLIVYLCCLAFIFTLSCSPQIIPVQMARITQVENYKEFYIFDDVEHCRNVLRKVVGDKNWRIIEEHYVFGDVVQDLLDGQIEIEGTMIFTMSLDPHNQDLFYVEGFGKYHVYRKTKDEVILSADFTLVNDEAYSRSQLQQEKFLELKARRFYTRYFANDERNYLQNAPLTFRLQVKEIKPGIFSLDYDARHKVLIADEVMGELEFQQPNRHKLIDLRSVHLLRQDY